MSNILVLLFVLAAGLCQPFQVAMNTKLAKVTGSPAYAALVSFAGGIVVTLVLWAVGVLGRGQANKLADTPWWSWLTGPIAVLIVVSALTALPKTNAGVVVTLMVLGQATASLVVDHYGWLDIKKTPANAWRIAGVVLILGGTLLMQKR